MKNGPLTEGKTKSQHKKIEHFGLEPPPPPPPRPTGEIIMEGFTKPHRTLGSFISKLFKKEENNQGGGYQPLPRKYTGQTPPFKP